VNRYGLGRTGLKRRQVAKAEFLWRCCKSFDFRFALIREPAVAGGLRICRGRTVSEQDQEREQGRHSSEQEASTSNGTRKHLETHQEPPGTHLGLRDEMSPSGCAGIEVQTAISDGRYGNSESCSLLKAEGKLLGTIKTLRSV